jgi:hypothetical protein
MWLSPCFIVLDTFTLPLHAAISLVSLKKLLPFCFLERPLDLWIENSQALITGTRF